MNGRVSWIEGMTGRDERLENRSVAAGFTCSPPDDGLLRSRLISLIWDKEGEDDLEPEDKEIVSVQRAKRGGKGGGETFWLFVPFLASEARDWQCLSMLTYLKCTHWRSINSIFFSASFQAQLFHTC